MPADCMLKWINFKPALKSLSTVIKTSITLFSYFRHLEQRSIRFAIAAVAFEISKSLFNFICYLLIWFSFRGRTRLIFGRRLEKCSATGSSNLKRSHRNRMMFTVWLSLVIRNRAAALWITSFVYTLAHSEEIAYPPGIFIISPQLRLSKNQQPPRASSHGWEVNEWNTKFLDWSLLSRTRITNWFRCAVRLVIHLSIKLDGFTEYEWIRRQGRTFSERSACNVKEKSVELYYTGIHRIS